MFVGPILFSGRWRAFAGGGAGRALARRNVFCYPPLSYTEIGIRCYIFLSNNYVKIKSNLFLFQF